MVMLMKQNHDLNCCALTDYLDSKLKNSMRRTKVDGLGVYLEHAMLNHSIVPIRFPGMTLGELVIERGKIKDIRLSNNAKFMFDDSITEADLKSKFTGFEVKVEEFPELEG